MLCLDNLAVFVRFAGQFDIFDSEDISCIIGSCGDLLTRHFSETWLA